MSAKLNTLTNKQAYLQNILIPNNRNSDNPENKILHMSSLQLKNNLFL